MYTVRVRGHWVRTAQAHGLHAYHSDVTNVTAIEIPASDSGEACRKARALGSLQVIDAFP